MRVRYVGYARVAAVTEITERHNWRKTEGIGSTCDEQGTGVWAIRIDGCSAIYLPEKPDVQVGDQVKLTVEKV